MQYFRQCEKALDGSNVCETTNELVSLVCRCSSPTKQIDCNSKAKKVKADETVGHQFTFR